MENTHPPKSISQLPDDCLHHIFEKLNSSSDRESFGLTCQRWLHIQNLSRRSLHFECSFTNRHMSSLSRSPMDVCAHHLSRLLIRFSQLKTLDLSGCTTLPDSGLSVFLSHGSELQSLCLDCCFGMTDVGISYVARGCPLLETLSLYLCNITDMGLKILSEFCLSLQDVNLSHCPRVTDSGIRYLSRNCRQLRAVNISHSKSVNGIGFQGCSETLAYLEATACKLEPEGVQGIVSGGGLEYLNFSNLKWSVRGNGIASIGTEFISKLKVIDFRMVRTIGDDAIEKIAHGCPLLQEWNLALCSEIRVSGWVSIGSHCHNLERLHVNRCRNLCDQGLQGIRDGCRRLCRLYFGQCIRVSQMAVEMFKSARSDVEMIDEEIMCIAPNWALSCSK